MSAVATLTPVKNWIPFINPEELAVRLPRIRALVRQGGIRYFVQPTNPHGSDYRFNPQVAEQALLLRPAGDITTYHRMHDDGVFRPKIADVLAFIPAWLTKVVVGFELLGQLDPDNSSENAKRAYAEGYLAATFRLFEDA
jgi:hypothetical protein